MIGIDVDLVREIVRSGKRVDNRSAEEYRKITVEPNIITSAEGSARVKLGDTEVIAGVKMETGEPYPDSLDEGVLSVAAEFLPLASPDFEAGPPGEDAIELARVVDRAIRESKAIDFKKLCLKEGEKVWMVYVDIDILDNDGNLIDAAGLAAVTALMNTKIPDLDEEEKPVYDKKGKKSLPMKGIPVSTTFVKINGTILLDPDFAESEAMEARLTVGTLDSDGIQICSLQKGGSVGFSLEEIEKILKLAEKNSEQLRKMVKQ
jgi:exosome complex component RRP42